VEAPAQGSAPWRHQFVLGSVADESETDDTAQDEPSEQVRQSEAKPSLDESELGNRKFWSVLGRDIKDSPRDLWRDTKQVFGDKTNAVVLLLAGGASLALRPEVDDDIEDKFNRSRSLSEGWGDAAGALGNPSIHFAYAGTAYIYSVLAEDEENYQRSKTLISALIINGVTTTILKVAANTESPNGEELGWPSGHTSSTVALAAVLDEFYGPWAGVPLYGLAGLVAYERLDDNEHHLSDVVFGAALGYIVGKTVVRGRHPEILGGRITPYISPAGGSGIAWVRKM
jgi:hypothetical protein